MWSSESVLGKITSSVLIRRAAARGKPHSSASDDEEDELDDELELCTGVESYPGKISSMSKAV
jgi:hypothetical protein